MYKIPSKTKKEVKIAIFYFMDIIIIVGAFFIGENVGKILNLTPSVQFINYSFWVILGVWLCIRNENHPVDRNLFMVLHIFRSNRNRYDTITLEHYSSITSEGENK